MLELVRETAPAHVEMMLRGFPVMPGRDFSAAGHFAVMPGKVESMSRELFLRPRELFSRPGRPFSRPARLKVMRGMCRCSECRPG